MDMTRLQFALVALFALFIAACSSAETATTPATAARYRPVNVGTRRFHNRTRCPRRNAFHDAGPNCRGRTGNRGGSVRP